MNKFALTLTALSVMTSVSATAGDAILDVHGDIKVNGKTVITAEGQVLDASLVDLSKYLVWPAGIYTFTTKNMIDEVATIAFDENGNETYFKMMKGGEITEEESAVFHADGSYTETEPARVHSNTWNHYYAVIEMRPYMCDERDPETGEPTGGQSPCSVWALIMDENGNPILDEDGNLQFEMEYDVDGNPILDDFGNHKYVEVDEYEHHESYNFNVTKTESCAEELTFAPLGTHEFSIAKMGIPTSVALKEKVTGTRACDTTYTFPDGLPIAIEGLEDDIRAQGLTDGVQVYDVDNVSFETETVTPLVKVGYQLGEDLLTDCIILKQTESNDLYNQRDNGDTDTEINTYCAGIGLVEHREPANSDNGWKEIIMQRTSHVAAE